MNPETAIDILDQALANLNGTREAHNTILQAVEVLREAIKLKRDTILPTNDDSNDATP